MEAVGCTPLIHGRPDSGAVAILLPVGRPAVFNCASVSRDSVGIARQRYYHALTDSIGGEHIEAGYWDISFVGSREWCYADGNWGPDGLFHLTESTSVYGCFDVDSYSRTWVSTSDEGFDWDYYNAGGGGATNPGSPPDGDLQPAPVPDTPCQLPASMAGEPTPDSVDASANVDNAYSDIDNSVPVGVTECAGSGALDCMNNDPGVYLGVLPLKQPLGLIFNHTAIATTPPMGVSELWAEQSGASVPLSTSGIAVPIYLNNVHVHESAPQSSKGFPGYRWIKIAGTDQIDNVNAAVDYTKPSLQNMAYMGTSNVFVGNVLGHAGITLDPSMVSSTRFAPGLCTCPGVCANWK